MTKENHLYAIRHSLAHIMAAAVQRKWPNAKFGVGPVVESGFYYDVDLGDVKLSDTDLRLIEADMNHIVEEDLPFERFEMPIDEAVIWARESGQPYKEELLHDLQRAGTTIASELEMVELGLPVDGKSKVETVSFYRNGSFTDLCRGPHVKSTGKVGPFALQRVSGAYWRGKETNPQMQRIYGIAFSTPSELKNYLDMLDEAKRRDHRRLGQELDLFVFSDLIGPGLPLFTPRGTILRKQLDGFVQSMRDEYGYQEVSVPHITKKDAYIVSGHWKKFQHELFRITTREGHEFAMKPMNCPHHTQLYASRARSYKDLPLRYRETTMCYRDEQSGELSGLSRVRAFTQDDAHVFCRTAQLEDEVMKVWDIIDRFYGTLGFELNVRFSTHDSKNMNAYSGSEDKWRDTEEQLLRIVKQQVGEKYALGVGEAAFYGPKIDFMAKDALGRTWQVATIQLDFNQPEGFDLVCSNEQGERERIVMVHAAIMGSIERFLSVYLEHTAGKFPIWLAPEQVRFITVNQESTTEEFANSILMQARKLGVRATVDNTNESVGKKIRAAELMKVPYAVVLGEKEIATSELLPRIRKDLSVDVEHTSKTIEEFLKTVSNEARSRVNMSSL